MIQQTSDANDSQYQLQRKVQTAPEEAWFADLSRTRQLAETPSVESSDGSARALSESGLASSRLYIFTYQKRARFCDCMYRNAQPINQPAS